MNGISILLRAWRHVKRERFTSALGVFAGILFLVILAPFGLGPRVAGSLLALALGVTAGFMKIKGLKGSGW